MDFLISGNMTSKLSDASQHFLSKTGVLGAFFMWEEINEDSADIIEDWVTQRYAEENGDNVVVDTNITSNFVIEVDV